MITAPWMRRHHIECPKLCDPPCHYPVSQQHTRAAREYYVYWLFSADGECLYIGMTSHPEARWTQHRYQRPEMIEIVKSRRMAGPYNFYTALRIEREQQDLLKPRFDGRLRGIETRKATLALRRAEGASA